MQSLLHQSVEIAMPPLPVPREETFAHVLAMGLSPGMAGGEAGYAKHWKHVRKRVARPDIVARAGELGDARQWGETRDAGEMIGALMRLAAAMVAARGLVAEAAKLDQRTLERREAPDATPAIAPCFLPLSDEAWTAKYGHRAQPGAAA
jgi:hypothetical protein